MESAEETWSMRQGQSTRCRGRSHLIDSRRRQTRMSDSFEISNLEVTDTDRGR